METRTTPSDLRFSRRGYCDGAVHHVRQSSQPVEYPSGTNHNIDHNHYPCERFHGIGDLYQLHLFQSRQLHGGLARGCTVQLQSGERHP